jgi:ABC-type transport system involved in cytochrome c biogenesis permease subunit
MSYLLAFLVELAGLRWPRAGLRLVGLALGGAGLLAHSSFMAVHHPTPASAYGALLAVAWLLAIVYLYGTLHYSRRAWAIFVLPILLGLVALAFPLASRDGLPPEYQFNGSRLWGALHGFLLLFAAVGICLGCVASLMYLIQARRLRKKLNPLGGIRLLSLERLEVINRTAVNLAFPMLTVGLLLGAVLLRQYHDLPGKWLSPKVLGTVGLWLVFLVLLYLRYGVHVSGRRLAWLTLLAFTLMLLVLVAAHPFAAAGGTS